jgi:hypothetical protein
MKFYCTGTLTILFYFSVIFYSRKIVWWLTIQHIYFPQLEWVQLVKRHGWSNSIEVNIRATITKAIWEKERRQGLNEASSGYKKKQ